VPRAAAHAEKAGLLGVTQIHERTRRHRHQLAAVGFLQQLACHAQIAAADLHDVADMSSQRDQGTMIEEDRAGHRTMGDGLSPVGVADQHGASQRIGRIGGEHIEQLGLLLREGHTGEACRVRRRQSAFAARLRKRIGNGLRRGDAQVAADQFGGTGQHAALHARGKRRHHA
jgi:hypothetical protein